MKLHITVTPRNAVSALLLLIIPYFPGIASLISDLYNLRGDAGRDWCGAGGHTFVRTADAAVHKSAKNAL